MEKLMDNHKAYIPSPGGRGRRGGGNTSFFTLTPCLPAPVPTEGGAGRQPSPLGDCVVIGAMVKNVMLNLFQHLIESNTYETLNQVQGDKKGFTTQSLKGEGVYFRSLKIGKS
jgi:hypothetical protein